MARMKLRRPGEVLILLLVFSLPACTSIYNPATGREETIYRDRESEIAVGQGVARELEKIYKVSTDKELSEYIVWMGERVASSSDRIDLPYRFVLLETAGVNAMALPGGPVYVTRGLVDLTSQDELACVIGHELGHTAARHGAKRMEKQGIELAVLAVVIASGNATANRAASRGLAILQIGYDQEAEILADCLGAKYAGKSGFDPRATLTLLDKLRGLERERGGGGGWFRSHPPTAERIRSVTEWLKENEGREESLEIQEKESTGIRRAR